ncbi:MAG: ABC transporter ATP-binding protein [Bacteroides sp.]|nr:ABC transporter ATP-binding protein [Bacteroides sp.]
MIRSAITIRVRNLSTGYTAKGNSITVTRGIDASLKSGELTCLLGPNGAGKSTLLKTLSGFINPLGGDIEIGGRNLSDYSAPGLARVIGVVLTERVSLDNMSVYELVSMGRSPYTGFWGRMSREDKHIVDSALALVGIESLRRRMVHTLSDGERQKVMIAKALAQETPVIFLDEPTAFLDYPSKVEIMQLLQRLAREEGKTVFLSTHDLELALQIADKVWLIDKERGVEIGTPEDLALSGELGAYFKREGVAFDIETGLFRIDNRLDCEIRLIGGGTRYNMVRKALARCGVRGSQDVDSPHTIEVTDDTYLVNGRTCPTIAALLEEVRTVTHSDI